MASSAGACFFSTMGFFCHVARQISLRVTPDRSAERQLTLSALPRACLNPARLPPSSSARTSASLTFCAARFALPLLGGAAFVPRRDGLPCVDLDVCERVLVDDEDFDDAVADDDVRWLIEALHEQQESNHESACMLTLPGMVLVSLRT